MRRCNRQFAKYACPQCNIPYCSLTCFRSERHNQCSEGFYRDQIQSDIRTVPSATAQEQLKMMELLQRFEESSAEEVDLDDEDEEENALAQRLKGVDLDSVSPDDLWDLLPEGQRAKFLKTVEDPSSNLTKQLLADGGLLHKQFTPWWKSHEDPSVKCPTMMSIPRALVERMPNDGPSLLYNICAACIVYAYVCRHFQVSRLTDASAEETTGIKGVLSSIAHFVTDRKSEIIHAGLSAIVTDLWSRLGENQISPGAFSLILQDASVILRPRVVTEVRAVMEPDGPEGVTPSSHPNENILRVLSDMARLYDRGDSDQSTQKRRDVATSRKLRFYAARVMCTPEMTLRVLAEEVLAQSKLMVLEPDGGGQSQDFFSPRTRTTPVRPRPIIEEL
ncbi:hypothetical protein BDM02DRAFT_3100173 [Thelephora ganbajun]|uniref:Uncharacterized protein n=1 Tax=Thelephora ganbajun TaxID=370292 RepID=A0ACB6ZA03_THEGA|nr:hypothetical protein BDM02DRAFT_3100173 [Thelephora ganbajun]